MFMIESQNQQFIDVSIPLYSCQRKKPDGLQCCKFQTKNNEGGL